MARVRLAKSTPFRLALLFSMVFLIIFLCAALIAIHAVRSHLLNRMDAQIQHAFSVIAGSYGESDIDDLKASVDAIARA